MAIVPSQSRPSSPALLEIPTHSVCSVVALADGRRIISGSLAETVKVWTIIDGPVASTVAAHAAAKHLEVEAKKMLEAAASENADDDQSIPAGDALKVERSQHVGHDKYAHAHMHTCIHRCLHSLLSTSLCCTHCKCQTHCICCICQSAGPVVLPFDRLSVRLSIVRLFIRADACMHTCMCGMFCTHAHRHAHTDACAHACLEARALAYMYTCAHQSMHARTHGSMHAWKHPWTQVRTQ